MVLNTGEAAAKDVRVEICVPNGQDYGIIDWSEAPEVPKRRENRFVANPMRDLKIRPVVRRDGYVDIDRGEHETKVEIECGNLQPGRKVWTDEFYLGVGQSGEFEIKRHLFAANLAKPQEFTLTIDADITRTSMTADELIELADSDVKKEVDDD
ncbi:hypothetical protein Pla108_34140 [Botrimarina colliarenosi]|uniref:Uncharacterized protein n=1 Tax=Botrimarina colliarenosi TaxID=2528001 RepID=A0A5C6A7A3_9BACT|nr:hypothetical protein [Botrimarina colliarenosi]TWT95270.1 hypothetical protein Pla108_34140 [Botrimarina colliarenosi]